MVSCIFVKFRNKCGDVQKGEERRGEGGGGIRSDGQVSWVGSVSQSGLVRSVGSIGLSLSVWVRQLGQLLCFMTSVTQYVNLSLLWY